MEYKLEVNKVKQRTVRSMREMLFFPLIWVKLVLVSSLADFDDVAGNLFLSLSSDCLCTDAC